MRVTEIQRGDDLPEELPRLLWRKAALLHQIIEQLTTGNVLQHQISAKLYHFIFFFWAIILFNLFFHTQIH